MRASNYLPSWTLVNLLTLIKINKVNLNLINFQAFPFKGTECLLPHRSSILLTQLMATNLLC